MANGATGAPTLQRSLGFWNLVLFGVVYTAPISTFTLFGFVYERADGAVIPAYVLGSIGAAFTGLSYGAMAETAPSAGSA